MVPADDFVAHLRDEPELLITEPAISVVGLCRGLFQQRMCGNHLARDEVGANAEVFQ